MKYTILGYIVYRGDYRTYQLGHEDQSIWLNTKIELIQDLLKYSKFYQKFNI